MFTVYKRIHENQQVWHDQYLKCGREESRVRSLTLLSGCGCWATQKRHESTESAPETLRDQEVTAKFHSMDLVDLKY